ncbi:MAG: YggU family protein [Thiomargarita sp.]|nr:YggU family protein [Bacteroidales bacterium]MCK5718377.1 YggU family protein [Thiomargarita sp.]
MPYYQWQDKDLLLFIRVSPRASRSQIVGIYGDRLKVKTTAAPIDGKANADICKLFAKTYGVAKSKIIIQKGQTSRDKCLRIHAPKKCPNFITL